MSLGAEMPRTPEELVQWAAALAEADMVSVVGKIQEYGAIDLEVMGLAIADLIPHDVTMVRGMEASITFYLLGKISRSISALAKGEPPSADTRKDIRVYAAMLEHVSIFGHWGKFNGEGEADFLDVDGR